MDDSTVNVRYMVDDVDAAVAFYTTHFGFVLNSSAAPAFADIVRGDLRLLLSGPKSSAGRPMPDGRQPGLAGGTASISSSTTSRPRSRAFARRACVSGATSSAAPVASRSSSTIPPVI